MNQTGKHTFLMVGLSVLLFRVVSLILHLGFLAFSQIHLGFVQHAISHIQFYVPLIACGSAVFLGQLLAHQLISQKPLVGVIIWIVALLPIQVQTVMEPAVVPTMHFEEKQAEPIRFVARVIAGEDIRDEVLLDNSHVNEANGVSMYGDSWQIRLGLTQEGQERIREATRVHVGDRIGFFLDGDLRSSPEIMEPLDIPYIMLSMDLSASEAGRIADGIMKGRGPQQQ